MYLTEQANLRVPFTHLGDQLAAKSIVFRPALGDKVLPFLYGVSLILDGTYTPGFQKHVQLGQD